MTLRELWPVTQQFQNKNGSNLVGGKIYIYYQGRTALATTYHDEEGTVVNANPVLLDNNGRATVFADTIYSYTIVVCDYYGKELFSQDITLHDAISTAKDVIVMGSDGSVKVDTTTLPNGVQYDLSVNTDIIATNESIANKKDKQDELNFNGSATKTVKSITQNVNGELNVEFEDIDLPQEVPNVEIKSEDKSVKVTESTDSQTNTKTFDLSVDSITNIASSDGSINVTSANGNVNLTLPSDVVRDSSYTHIDAATANPLMNSNAAVGVSTKYAREDHIHPTDTSREAIANKTTVILGTSDIKYPTDKAVAEFVNSSIATNTANYISNNGVPFTSVEQLNAYTGTVTNNDYAFVMGTDSEGNTYYDRYKATVSGSTVTWSLEYRLNNNSFTAAQWSAINSGITSVLVANIHTHSNKDVLDGITSSDVSIWNSKQNSLTAGDNITIDGDIISSNQLFVARYGVTTYKEIEDAYKAGKICVLFSDHRYYYFKAYYSNAITFESSTASGTLYSVAVFSADNHWQQHSLEVQPKLTFDTKPTAGSNNPVTSDGIYKSMYRPSKPATPSSFTKDGKSYSFICRTNVRAWVKAAFEGYAFPADYQVFDTIRIRTTVYGDSPTDRANISITCGKQIYEKYNFVQAIYNGYCYIFATNNPFYPLYINPNKYINSDSNSSSITQDIFQTLTLTKITPSIDDVILDDTPKNNSPNPITSGGVKIAIDKLQSKLTFDTTPTAGSNNPVTSNGIKTALDSRIPAPTSTTGTQVLKCIDGVIQWVIE